VLFVIAILTVVAMTLVCVGARRASGDAP